MARYILAASLIFALAATGCSTQDLERREFLNAAAQWSALLRDAGRGATHRMTYTTEPTGKKSGVVHLSLPQKTSSIEQHRNQWIGILRDFHRIASRTPPTRWSDDAAFCEALVLITMHRPGTDIGQGSVERCWELLRRDTPIELEDDTKQLLIRYLHLEASAGSMSSEEIRSFLQRAIISELLRDGKVTEASEQLEQFKGAGLTEQEYQQIRETIRLYKLSEQGVH